MGKLEEIEARANAATDGPWRADEMRDHGDSFEAIKRAVDIRGPRINLPVALVMTWQDERPSPEMNAEAARTAEFIAGTREDVPWLIARVRLLEAALKGNEWKFDGWMSMKCPECDNSEPDHYDDCKIGAALHAELPTLTPSV